MQAKLGNKTINSAFFQNFLLIAFALSGASALTYEVVWTRAFSLVIGSSTYAMSTVLAAFMAGLSLGSLLGGYLADKKKDALFCPTCFAFLEIATGFLGLLILPIIIRLSPIYAWLYYRFNLSFSQFSLAQLIVVFLILLPPTILMGATFPLVLKARANLKNKPGTEAGSVYAFNTVGAIFGSLATGFILVPYVGMLTASVVAAVTNLSVGFATLLLTRVRLSLLLPFTITFSLVAFFALTEEVRPFVFNYYLAGRYQNYEQFLTDTEDAEVVKAYESPYGLVAVIKSKANGGLSLINHGKVEGSNKADLLTQELTALLPLTAKKGQASSVLNIGVGTGTTINAALRAKKGLQIDAVEINAKIKDLSFLFYPQLKKEPKINWIIADARHYLFLTPKKYDVIASEPSYPTEYQVSNLFTKQFFQLVKKRLHKDGVFAQWLPAYLLQPQDVKIAIKTLGSVFKHLEFYQANSNLIILASQKKQLSSQYVVQLAFKNLSSAAKKTGQISYLPQASLLVKQLKADVTVHLNTDLNPVLEFAAARNLIRTVPY
jgi:spermidine synthase